jgi:hypothetical protein
MVVSVTRITTSPTPALGMGTVPEQFFLARKYERFHGGGLLLLLHWECIER